MGRVFEEKKYHYYEMATSYRSTIEIINFANDLIRHCENFTPLLAQPVLRHGEMPKLITCATSQERLDDLQEQIRQLRDGGMHAICILTQCKEASEQVRSE